MDNPLPPLGLQQGPAFSGIVSFLRSPLCGDIEQLDADIAILGAPTDEGNAWIPGQRFAPRAIREMSVRLISPIDRERGYYDFDEDRHYLHRELTSGRIADCGDVRIIHTNVEQTFANISDSVRSILLKGAMPVVIGGDHAITFGVVRGFSEQLDVVHFDAHLDYSEFAHGGPTYANSNPLRLTGKLPHVGRIVQVGMRHNSKIRLTDLRDSRERGNDVVSVKQLRQRGIDRVLEHVEPGRKVYVSIDIDVLDMPLVPGCGSGEVGGLDYSELAEALFYVASRYQIVGFDLVEVNPMLDVPARNTSYLAAQIVTDFLGRIVEQPSWKAAHNVRDEVPAAADGR